MIVITICSFMLNFPGLRLQVYPRVVNWRVGRTFSRSLPAKEPLSTTNCQPLLVVDQSGQDAQQLGEAGTNESTGVPNAEELINESGSSNEKGANDPGTECTSGRIWVIMVIDYSTDLGIGRILQALHQRPACAMRIRLRHTTMIRAASILSSW
jgi:hypothetical protein